MSDSKTAPLCCFQSRRSAGDAVVRSNMSEAGEVDQSRTRRSSLGRSRGRRSRTSAMLNMAMFDPRPRPRVVIRRAVVVFRFHMPRRARRASRRRVPIDKRTSGRPPGFH
jgi:hypothetical protein